MAHPEGHQVQDRVILSGPPTLLQLQAGVQSLVAWRGFSDLMRSWIPVLSAPAWHLNFAFHFQTTGFSILFQ